MRPWVSVYSVVPMNHNKTVIKLESKLVQITRFVATGDDKTSNFSLRSEDPKFEFCCAYSRTDMEQCISLRNQKLQE